MWFLRVIKAYWYVVSIFIGGLVATMIFPGLIGFLHLKALPPERAMTVSWIAGALLTAIGSPMGWARWSMSGTSVAKLPERSVKPVKSDSPPNRSLKFALSSGGTLAFAGGMAGFLLGGTFMIIWLSISVSPLAPAQWGASVGLSLGGIKTSNPVPILLWLGPAVAGALLGFAYGVVGAPLGWVTETTRPRNPLRPRRAANPARTGSLPKRPPDP